MIYGVVSIKVKPGKRNDFVQLFSSNAVKVRQEKGCFRYMLTADIVTGIPIQVMDEETLTLLEEWESMTDIENHMMTPHMAAYFEKEKDLVGEVVIKMLQEL